MKPVNWKRVLRLTTAALVFLFIAANFGLSWVYVDALVRPGCGNIVPIPGRPPDEVIHLDVPEDDLQLEAWYYIPENGAAIVAMGGAHGSLGVNLPPVAFLLDEGFGVLQMAGRNCTGALVTLGGKEVREAEAALRWLETRPEVHRIGLYGFSMGGAGALRAAAVHPSFEAVAAEGGYFNLGEDIVEPDAVRSPLEIVLRSTIAGVFWLRTGVNPWQTAPVDVIGEISPRPVLLIYGEFEQVSGRAALQYAAAGEPKTLWIVPSGAHGTNYAVAGAAYERRLLDFFRYSLVGPAD